MEITNLNIVMLMFQPSVVAKGLEKKLQEQGNTVSSVVGNVNQIDQYMDSADLFILNLPGKITDDTEELKALKQLCKKMDTSGKKMIMVGEKEVYQDLIGIFKAAGNFEWVFRPVQMQELEIAIDKAFTGKPKPEGARKRILIVDDDPDYAKMVREWISEKYKVDIVTAGMKAIAFLLKVPEDEGVDLILLDYEMPIADGPQVLQMLRQEPATAHIPVVFLTGVGTREGVARVMELKPDGYILKSTTRDDLLQFLSGKLDG
jgi:DNA-binding response OmpR family regulator